MTARVKTKKGGFVEVLERELEELQGALRGSLIRPGDVGYDAARAVWNGLIDRHPALIVRCAEPNDVITAVKFATERELATSIRSGGHNVAGTSVVDEGLVFDLGAMRGVRVDPDRRVVRAEGGARLGDLDQATQQHGLAVPVGVVSRTGLAGLLLHGGAGWLLRKHGLSIDHLLAAEIVTADGSLLRASADEHPDLFWALRGGGGNFGVVTAFELAAHPVGPTVVMSAPIYPLERANEVLRVCRDYMREATPDLSVLAVYWSAPDVPEVPAAHRGAPVIILVGCYTGPLERADEAIGPLRGIGRPIADLGGPRSWLEAQRFFDDDYPDGAFYYWKSIYLDTLDDRVIELLSEHAALRPSPISSVDVWFTGGAFGRVPAHATAFRRRDAEYMLGIEANWTDPHPRAADANIAWARALHRAASELTRGGEYLNFPGFVEEGSKLLEGVYGQNLARLRQIKATYDPDNFFPGLLNIAPANARL